MEKYEVLGKIGTGSFGSVTKVRRKNDGRILVWKEIRYGKMSEKEKQQLVTEVNILRELKHPNVVKYYDRILDKKNTKIYIVMEFCSGGDLGQMIKGCLRDRTTIEEATIWKVFGQCVSALNSCHYRKEGKIIHRDIKPGNIFLDAQKNVKLGDFGLSRVMGKDSVYAYTHVGTPYYMSPEQITDARYTEKSDVWSLGCIVYEMATLKPPFQARNHVTLAMKIKEGRFDRLPSRYSEELNRTIQWMLNVDYRRRPSVSDLTKLPPIAEVMAPAPSRERREAPVTRDVPAAREAVTDRDRRDAPTDRDRRDAPVTREPTRDVPAERNPYVPADRNPYEAPREVPTSRDAGRARSPVCDMAPQVVTIDPPAPREAELRLKAAELQRKEDELQLKEDALKRRESDVTAREDRLRTREAEFESRQRRDRSPSYTPPPMHEPAILKMDHRMDSPSFGADNQLRPTTADPAPLRGVGKRPFVERTNRNKSPVISRDVSYEKMAPAPAQRGISRRNKENNYRPRTAAVRKKPNLEEINRYIAVHKKNYRHR